MRFKALGFLAVSLLFVAGMTHAQDSYQGFHVGQSLGEAFAAAGVGIDKVQEECANPPKELSSEQKTLLATVCPKINLILAGEPTEIDFPKHQIRLAFNQLYLVRVTGPNGTILLQESQTPSSVPSELVPVPTTIHGQRMNETAEEFVTTMENTTTHASVNCTEKLSRNDKSFCKQIIAAESGHRTTIKTDSEMLKMPGYSGSVDMHNGWTWTFDHNHLVKVSFTDYNNGKYSDYLKQAIQKYGNPSDEGTTDWQNGFGARFTSGHAMWIQPDHTVIFLKEAIVELSSITSIEAQTKEEFEGSQGKLQEEEPKL